MQRQPEQGVRSEVAGLSSNKVKMFFITSQNIRDLNPARLPL